ncbi:MAG: tripartite tricarboxylate transporter TctB family protein [Burkholderiales bacterium]
MDSRASLALALGLMAVSGYGVIAAWAWPWKASLFPLVIGIPVFVLAAVEVLWVLFGTTARGEVQDFQIAQDVPERVVLGRTANATAWIFGFFAAIVLLGFPVAVPLFVFLYLKLEGGEGWVFSIVYTAAIWVFFYGLFDRLLHLPFLEGWLLAWFVS